MKKVLSSSRKLTDDSDPADLEDVSQPLVGDFSSHDLIRNRIADPSTFEPPPKGPPSDDIVVVSDNALKAELGNVNSRWSFSMNPLSYFQRSDNQPGDNDAPRNDLERDNREIGQDDRPISSPQLASTPNDY